MPAVAQPVQVPLSIATNPAMLPRWYQMEAAQAALDYFLRGNTGNPIIALPTGTGKSLVQALFMALVLGNWPRQRFLCLTHVKELIAQNAADCLEFWPNAPVGIYSAGLDQRVAHTPIVFGGVATVVNCIEMFGHRDVLMIDECHLFSGKDASMYGKVIAGLRSINPHLKVIGLTATPYRTGQGLLTDGELFTDVVYDMTTMSMFNLLIAQGYLCSLRPKPTNVEIDVSGIHTSNGDYNLSELQAVSDVDAITDGAVREMCHFGQSKHAWLTFASGVQHAEHVNDRLRYYGVPSTVVHGDLSNDERDRRIDDFKAGRYVSIVNYGVLTTGFNHKPIDLIAHLRATESTGLWVQMNGRGTRPVYAGGYDLSADAGRYQAIQHGPKPYCLALDFAGNTKRLGPINDPVLPRKKGSRSTPGVAPIKICPQCNFYNHTRAAICCNCDYEFPKQSNLNDTASIDALLRDDKPVVELFNVLYVLYSAHTFRNGKPHLVVTYHCGAMGIQMFQDRIWLENDGASKHWAREWWRKRYVGDGTARRPQSFVGYTPNTVAEALTLTDQLKTPRSIRVRLDKREPEIIGYDY